MTKNLNTTLTLLALALAVGCNDGPRKIDPLAGSPAPTRASKPGGASAPGSTDPTASIGAEALAGALGFGGLVEETMNAGRYTYVLVDTGTEKRWVAAPVFAVAVGDRVEFPAPVLMENFHSPTLERDFEEIYFVSSATVAGKETGTTTPGALPAGHPPLPGSSDSAGLPHGGADVGAQTEEPSGGATTTASDEAGSSARAARSLGADGFTGKVSETMSTGPYTYVQVEVGEERHWVAAPTFAVEVGDTITVPRGMMMQNFHSPTLDRTFEKIFFVGKVHVPGRDQDAAPKSQVLPDGHPALPGTGTEPSATQLPPRHPALPGTEAESDSKAAAGTEAQPLDPDHAGEQKKIEKVEGGQTIAEIIGAKNELAGKEVLFRGKVVKFNAGILSRNWLHVQDGSGSAGTNDLTVTTDAAVRVGQTVVVRGTLTLDKDFGAGYRYDVIVENASVTGE